jgi:hypothetical protein
MGRLIPADPGWHRSAGVQAPASRGRREARDVRAADLRARGADRHRGGGRRRLKRLAVCRSAPTAQRFLLGHAVYQDCRTCVGTTGTIFRAPIIS